MSQCPKCGSEHVVSGLLGLPSTPAIIRPTGLKSFSVSQDAGARLATAEALACLDCGLVWSSCSPAKLQEFIQRHCRTTEPFQPEQCLSCRGNRVIMGKFVADHRPTILPAVFDPSGRQAFTFTLGGPWFTGPAMACLDCGFVCGSTSAEKLRRYIRKNCDETQDNAAAFQGASPPSGWKEMWIGGVLLPLVPIAYGVYCLYTGHAYFPRRRGGPTLDVQGWEALVLALGYIAAGLFLHFQFFWGRHPGLRPWSARLKNTALLVAFFGAGYALLRRYF